jgi:ABC-type Fe3+/spermidine/putrescine transport system ATPase subunit
MPATGLSLSAVTKRFESHIAVRNLSLRVDAGRVLALLGPSGSGKTTTLRLIAGFETPDEGTVSVDGRDVTRLGPAERRFGMVFQSYALFPHLDVAQNIGFGLNRSMSRAERDERVAEVLSLVDLSGFQRRKVTELSGGQQQRVAVARAVAPRPKVLLLDEPLSNLDPALRERTRRQLRSALERVGVTTVFVTHEQEEAFALGDVVAVLNDGVLEQMAAPAELYDEPASHFVSTFVGRASTVRGTMASGGRVRIADGIEWPAAARGDPPAPGEAVLATVRPEAITFADGKGLDGVVRERRYTGARAFFEVETAVGMIEVEASVHAAKVGDAVHLRATACRVFPPASQS